MMLAWDEASWQAYCTNVLTPFVEEERRPALVLVLVSVPTRYQLAALNEGVSPEVALYPQRRLADFCEQRAITCIDTTDAFRPSSEPRVFFIKGDYLHFSEGGHQLLADYLWPQLRTVASHLAVADN